MLRVCRWNMGNQVEELSRVLFLFDELEVIIILMATLACMYVCKMDYCLEFVNYIDGKEIRL